MSHRIIASTRFGLLEGDRDPDGKTMRFRGVPFARSPVGDLRWRAPLAPERWDGVRPATSFGPACPQPAMPQNSLVFGQERTFGEDCLYLNIWTGSLDPAEKRPVIVWLHHGGFITGWGGAPFYDGAGMARAGAVHVTINYRLGRLGFLAHPLLSAEAGASGNYGLMDQLAALAWVKENIGAFGGDPDCITLYGVSAGAFSASLHMTSPRAKGLFERCIAGSGGAFGPSSDSSIGGDFIQTLDAAEALGSAVMAELGATDLEAMRSLSAERITAARETKLFGAPPGFLDGTYPIVDGDLVLSDAASAYRAGRFHDIPLITGSNEQECAVTPFNPDSESFIADNRRIFGPFHDRFAQLFPAGPDGVTAASSRDSQSDRLFSWQNWAFAREHAMHATAPTFYYRFAHRPPVPQDAYLDQQFTADVGAFHSAELPYALRNLASRDWAWREEDRALSNMLSGYWLDFARTGDPNGGGRPRWDSFDVAGKARMRFEQGAAHPDTAPCSARFDLLDDFYAWARESGQVTLAGAGLRHAA